MQCACKLVHEPSTLALKITILEAEGPATSTCGLERETAPRDTHPMPHEEACNFPHSSTPHVGLQTSQQRLQGPKHIAYGPTHLVVLVVEGIQGVGVVYAAQLASTYVGNGAASEIDGVLEWLVLVVDLSHPRGYGSC